MTITAEIYGGIKGREHVVDTPTDRVVTHNVGLSTAFADGLTDFKADRLWCDERTLSASSADSLDLAGGLTDSAGAAITFAKVRAIVVKAALANSADIVVGGAASNTFTGPFGGATHTVAVRPGGTLVLCAPKTGWPVTASTGDILKILNGSGSAAATYQVAILGNSA
ncbi:hypothetical protein [Xanthobacter flavus]|uniref:hypothetical protein n=1 Tax=Xanthobacter flavus TaxID=281 RepID=UPI0037273208